jgi:anti-anti-sigma factor
MRRIRNHPEPLLPLTFRKYVTANRNNLRRGLGTKEMLRIDIHSLNTVATLRCSGRLILGVETEMLRTMAQARHERIVRIDLSGVDKIDASGLGLLVELQIWARETRRCLMLVDLSEHVWRLVILTKLYTALEISYSDAPAMNAESDESGRREMIA